MTETRKIGRKERVVAIFGVAKLTFQAAPLAVFVQFGGALVNAILPIVTTYYASLTTTALVKAIGGSEVYEQQAITYVIITAGLGIAMTAWSSLEQYITTLMQYRVEAAMSDRMYEHFLRLDFWRYDDKKTIDTFDKANQFARFFPYVFNRLTNVLSQLISMVAGLFALVFVSWWLGLILIIAVIPGIVIQFRLSRAQTAHWNENVETRRSLNMIEHDLLQAHNMAELRLYGIIRYLLNLRLTLRDKDQKEQIEFERKFIFKRLFANAIEAAAEVIALLWTVMRIINKTLPIGQFIYVQQIVSRALGGASGFVSAINMVDEDLANLVDYQDFMKLPDGSGGSKQLQNVPEIITFENVTFSYPRTEAKVLQDVNFSIKSKQHIAIVGENGAGKSTLIKLLSGLYTPTKGAIFLDGVSLNDLDVSSWHKRIAVLSQSSIQYLFATAKDNIFFGDASEAFDEKRFEQALNWSESKNFLDKLPKGVDNYISTWMEDDNGNKGIALSGGQQQRLAIARNFYRDSPIIILDEPTSAIDALAESRIFKHLFEAKDKTVITISHRLSTVKKADMIYMFEEGRIVESGTHQELVDKKAAYYHMFESQL